MTILNNMSTEVEKKYLEIINNLDIGFFKEEFKGKLLMHNRMINKLLGFDPSTDLTGSSVSAFLANPEEQIRYYNELLKNGYIKDYITKIKQVNGDIITVQVNAHVVKVSDNKPLTIEGTISDITEKYMLEEKLKESERKYRGILENIKEGYFECDLKGNYTFVNDFFCKILRYSREELLKKDYRLLYEEETNREIFKLYNQLYKNEIPSPLVYEILLLTQKGEALYIEGLVDLKYDSEGNKVGFFGLIRDIRERKNTEQKLKDSEERYRTIFNTSPNYICLSDTEGNILDANQKLLEKVGIPIEQLCKMNIFEFYIDNESEVKRTLSSKIIAGEEIEGYELKGKTRHGKSIELELNAVGIKEDKKITKFLSFTRDITARKQVEQKLKESEEKYRSLYNNAEVGLFQTRVSDGRMLASNQKCAEMLGYDEIDQFLKDYVVVEHYVDSTVRTTMINKIKEEGCIKNYEAEVTDRYGIPHWWSYSARLYPDQDMIEGVLIDISERKEAEQKLKESEHQLDLKVKQLTTLYELPKLVETLDISLEDLILCTLNIIPPAHQFPDITTARIIYKDREYSLENFRETKWKMSIKMMIMKFPILIEVCYLENKSFISEEYDLLIEIGTQLKRILDGREIQKKLKESEETYRLLFESSTDGIASADMEGNFIEINKSFLDLLGYSREKLLKLNFRDITPQKWHEMEDNLIIKQFSEEKDSGIYEKEYIQKDGTILPINVRFWIIKDDQGDPVRMWFIVRDITDRKIAEKEISDLAKFPSENPNPVLRATQDRILYANRSGIELLKVDIEGNIPEFLHEIIQESLSKNIIQELDIELENHIYSFTISPIKAMGYVNIYGINITDRIKAEEEIANLAKFPSEDPYPVLRVNINNVLYINNAGQKLLKIDENDEIPEIFRVKINEAFINNAITEVEVIFKSRIYSFNIIPIIESNYINIYGMDITERKQVEQKLKEVNKLKSEFLRRASHELKTPLISIKGFSDLILSLYSDQLDMPIISKLKEINDGCERLQNIINNLLKTSRLESPDIRPKIQKEDLSFLIKFCLHELESLAERRKQSINLDIHSELHANIEKEEIHDVISNLITNAIKYTPPTGKIDIKTELKENFVVFSVKDNGIGFTEDQKKKIFQQFGKIERYGQGLDLGIDGTGLGLYISKRIVESHGGKIWMESEGRNKGSTFYFTIPIVK